MNYLSRESLKLLCPGCFLLSLTVAIGLNAPNHPGSHFWISDLSPTRSSLEVVWIWFFKRRGRQIYPIVYILALGFQSDLSKCLCHQGQELPGPVTMVTLSIRKVRAMQLEKVDTFHSHCNDWKMIAGMGRCMTKTFWKSPPPLTLPSYKPLQALLVKNDLVTLLS